MDATRAIGEGQRRDDDDWQRLLAAVRWRGAPDASASDAARAAAAAGPGVDALHDLYRPLLEAPASAPQVIAHLGQSLDGFIATASGESRFVTGHDNILHLHRLRALCDAVIVGAATVAADDPQLTTREVRGPNPLRVVLDPRRRLAPTHRLFTDRVAPTLLVHAAGVAPAAPAGVATLAVPATAAGLDLAALVAALRARGARHLFVEGGARTVTGFLQAGLLTRLHVAVAPLLIGAGTPSVRLPASAALADCLRAHHRVFRMGADVLFDLDLAARSAGGTPRADLEGLQRVL
jgi:riboflavin-specific deaminase-like protein